MNTTPTSFSNGWQKARDKRRAQWLKLIAADRNYSRILFGLPLQPPVRAGMRTARDEFAQRTGVQPREQTIID